MCVVGMEIAVIWIKALDCMEGLAGLFPKLRRHSLLFWSRPGLARAYCGGQKHKQSYRSNQESEH